MIIPGSSDRGLCGMYTLQRVAVYWSVGQRVAVCWECGSACCSVLECGAACCSVLEYGAACSSAVQCVPTATYALRVRCSVLQCVAANNLLQLPFE